MNERRIHTRNEAPVVRRRAEAEAPVFFGHAAVFDAEIVLWDGTYVRSREVIRRGAFARAIREAQDVIANVDHDNSMLLGRTSAGTVRLREDDVGLAVEIDAPDTTLGRDVATLMARADYRGMSIAFLPSIGGERQTVTTLPDGREDYFFEITDVDLFDVSIVGRPAYKSTDVGLRAERLESDRRRRALDAWVAERRRRIESIRSRLSPDK